MTAERIPGFSHLHMHKFNYFLCSIIMLDDASILIAFNYYIFTQYYGVKSTQVERYVWGQDGSWVAIDSFLPGVMPGSIWSIL